VGYSVSVPARARLLLAALLLLASTACGDDDGDEGLPPDHDAGLAEVFQPLFDPLGVEFTYGSVVDLDDGKHLALYVEPTGPATDEQYLERMLGASAAIVPFLFDAYPRLNSFDVCQEPVPTGPDDPAQPEPRTVVQLTRAQAATVGDWSTATLADLIRAARTGEGGEVRVDEAIARLPGWTAAEAEAGAPQPGPTSTPVRGY
jgi:hypothetical protein